MLAECQFHISAFAVMTSDMGGIGEKDDLEKNKEIMYLFVDVTSKQAIENFCYGPFSSCSK